MNVEEVHINIDKSGKVSLSLQGVKGEVCFQITKDLEALLGNEISERKFKHEYYEKPTQQDNVLPVRKKK
ncbi:MAG: DUF2997 domain-containing protein [Anaerolineaceae bacterium]|nr:DUF2997 domain-containing protein [Anaerolineaceae bacterium]